MRTILALIAMFATVVATEAAEKEPQHAYNFTVTARSGDVLGTGKLRLPFALGSNGRGTADWEFSPSRAYNTNKYWLKAKERLAKGSGKANARCSNSYLTLDFNPGWNDNNVTVGWQLKEQESGALSYTDFAGGHECARFKIVRSADSKSVPKPAQPNK